MVGFWNFARVFSHTKRLEGGHFLVSFWKIRKKCAQKKFRLFGWGLSGGSSVHRPGSEDPHGDSGIFSFSYIWWYDALKPRYKGNKIFNLCIIYVTPFIRSLWKPCLNDYNLVTHSTWHITNICQKLWLCKHSKVWQIKTIIKVLIIMNITSPVHT
jgi:hypothetical protein